MAAVAPSFVIYKRIQIPFSTLALLRQSETLTFGLKVMPYISLLRVALVTRCQHGGRYGAVDKMCIFYARVSKFVPPSIPVGNLLADLVAQYWLWVIQHLQRCC